MYLSKTYDCLPYDLLIAKLETYGLDRESLLLLSDYLGFPDRELATPQDYAHYFSKFFLMVERSGICNFADNNGHLW